MIFVSPLPESNFYFCIVKLFNVVLLSVLLLTNSVKVSLVYSWYALDMESFIEQLCENKETPQLQCNGKCFLSKISENTSTEERQTIPGIEWDQLVFCSIEISQNETLFQSKRQPQKYHYLVSEIEADQLSVFHPPQV